MDKNNEQIPMIERWKNQPPIGKTVGFRKISNEERIATRKCSLERKLKQGRITEEEADRSLETLYEELGMLVAK